MKSLATFGGLFLANIGLIKSNFDNLRHIRVYLFHTQCYVRTNVYPVKFPHLTEHLLQITLKIFERVNNINTLLNFGVIKSNLLLLNLRQILRFLHDNRSVKYRNGHGTFLKCGQKRSRYLWKH